MANFSRNLFVIQIILTIFAVVNNLGRGTSRQQYNNPVQYHSSSTCYCSGVRTTGFIRDQYARRLDKNIQEVPRMGMVR